MRVTGYKLNAKSIINENPGKCLLSSLILIFPKAVFAGCLVLTWVCFKANFVDTFFIVLGLLISAVLLFVLNAVCVPVGEISLFNLVGGGKAEAIAGEHACETDLDTALEFAFVPPITDSTREFHFSFETDDEAYHGTEATALSDFSSVNGGASPKEWLSKAVQSVQSFGFVRLLKLRLFLLTNLAKDIALTALPAIVIIAVFSIYVIFSPRPVAAFAAFSIGAFAVFLLAVMEIGLEYDKYRYVYLSLSEFARDFSSYSFPYKSLLGKSCKTASKGIGVIRKCEISFWGWTVLSVLLLPFIIPLIYFLPYKKLTLYNVIM